jgi:hypothetical protein
MQRVFIDTLSSDSAQKQLISLGMAASSGEEFYVEVPFPKTACTRFVQSLVAPSLGKVPYAACASSSLRDRMLTWLVLIRPIGTDLDICYDSEAHWEQFSRALDGRVPAWCQRHLIAGEIDDAMRLAYYKSTGLPLNHALYGARANRHAFVEDVAFSADVPDFATSLLLSAFRRQPA